MEEQPRKGWSDDELKASVEAYVEMKQFHQSGKTFSKKSYYESLATRFPRTAKSFELRMQNISFAYLDMGRDWLPGLKPAKNVGTNMLPRLKALIAEIDPIGEVTEKQFEAQVSALRKEEMKTKPKGNRNPPKQTTQTTSVVRDPEVKAYVLQEANGVCECCRNPAPFAQADGLPFLEVHHLKYLANGGSDTMENAAALCPNCHRAMHYAVNKNALLEKLYQTIPRLVRE
ncbi:HNH endonuclease [Brenneria goodwinii]|uniref:HNH endonuclease n=1 Tax=Brenneria goodwinii TaxID=1109412 RepID=UPI0036EB23BC